MYKAKTSSVILLTLIFFLLAGLQARSQEIKGVVTDLRTGEPMTGATVFLKGTGKKQYVQLDGKFVFKNLAPGSYILEVSYTNCKTVDRDVTVIAGKPATVQVLLEPNDIELSAVTILAGKTGSEAAMRNMEWKSNQLVNILSSRNIQLLPDITVANVMQRMSSVTIERTSSGEARYPIIRGMEKRYINTLVNGIKIPSPDNKNRFIPLDLFPSELLERLEVSKSLTPSMEGDAIGGTINLVMKDAPETKLFQANVSAGYDAIFGKQPFMHFSTAGINKMSPAEKNGPAYKASPSDFPVKSLNYNNIHTPINSTFGISAGNRFGREKRFGLLFSGSYQDIYSGTQSTLFLPDAQPNLNNQPSFVTLTSRKYSTENKRLGLNLKADYRFNPRNKLSLLNTYVRLDQLQTRVSFDTVALNSLVTASYRSSWQYQSIYNSTLQGLHELAPGLVLDWSVGYSLANNHIPDQAEFGHQYPVTASANYSDNLQTMTRNWEHNSDKDLSSYINLTKQLKLLNRPLEIKVGGLIRDKHRDNFYNAYTLNPQLPANTSFQTYTNINQAIFTFTGTNATPGFDGNNYKFHEAVSAGYAQGKWVLSDKLEALGGLRVEHTYQHFDVNVDSSAPGKTGTIYYTDFLPSGQLKYAIGKRQELRLSYYRALARPQFAELIPFGPNNYELFKETGNTSLRHSLADNFDLRYDLLGKGADQIMIGVFYKYIQDPIEFTARPVPPSSLNLVPGNVGKATNYGAEAVFTKYFGVFGISANYTYTQSKVTNDSMLYYYRGANGNITTKFVSESRPLQGQSNHIGSASLLYKNTRIGLDAQLALVYTGERISLVSPYAGLHYWQQPMTTLDFSFEKRFAKKFAFYGKLNNLTSAAQVQSIHDPYNTYLLAGGAHALSEQNDPSKKIVVVKNYIKPTFLFGIRYKL
ncbi:MAG TPA: TonB-dependent receptor [Puia sp.]|nr:TonB-dependent receptor [Puia sp.]